MSSSPGLRLEDFLRWNYDLIVENQDEANPSMGIAEVMGNAPQRFVMSEEEFKPLVAMFEHEREEIERLLMEFDEENQSWRGYAGAVFDYLPGSLIDQGSRYITSVMNKVPEDPKEEPAATTGMEKLDLDEGPIIKPFYEAITKLKFNPPEDPESDFLGTLQELHPLTHVIFDEKERDEMLVEYKKYFHELAIAIEMLAVETFPNVVIDEGFSERIPQIAEALLYKSFTGHPDYVKHLNKEEPKLGELGKEYINLNMLFGIVKPNKERPAPYLVWIVSAEVWKTKEDDPKLTVFVSKIEGYSQ